MVKQISWRMVALVFALLVPVVTLAKDDSDHPKLKPSVKKADNFKKFAKYIPLNQPIDKIEIPQYDEGMQTALLKAEVAWRVSETKFRMEMLEIQVFKNSVLVMTLTAPQARYNVDRGILASSAPSKIVHHGKPGLTALGHGMVFDMNRRIGSLLNGTSMELSVARSKSVKTP